MKKLIRVSDLRKVEALYLNEEITYSKMVELLNIAANNNLDKSSDIDGIKHSHYMVLCNTQQGLNQLSNAMTTYIQAKKFRDSDYNKKNYPYAFIVSVLDDA